MLSTWTLSFTSFNFTSNFPSRVKIGLREVKISFSHSFLRSLSSLVNNPNKGTEGDHLSHPISYVKRNLRNRNKEHVSILKSWEIYYLHENY